MSQILEAVRPAGFVLVPIHLLPFQHCEAIADVVRAYERALEEVRAIERPSIADRVVGRFWN